MWTRTGVPTRLPSCPTTTGRTAMPWRSRCGATPGSRGVGGYLDPFGVSRNRARRGSLSASLRRSSPPRNRAPVAKPYERDLEPLQVEYVTSQRLWLMLRDELTLAREGQPNIFRELALKMIVR